MKTLQVFGRVTVAVLAVAGWSHEVKAQNFFGSPQASEQAPSAQTAACYPTGCTPILNIPQNAIVPHPHPGSPGSDPNHCLVIYNGCPTPDKTYTVNKYYYVYYKIVNKEVPYDKIHVNYHPLPKVCSADNPCPPCVAAGGYGKADHAGTIGGEEELQAAVEATLDPQADAPAAPAPANAPPPRPAPAAAASAPAASAPAKTWVWLPYEGVYGYGSQRPDGLWDIDPGSRTSAPPSTTVAASQ